MGDSSLSAKDATKLIIKCVNFAAIKHKNQRRKDYEQTPYINHPIGVAHILTEEADVHDVNVIQAALLHDTVEDTDTSFEEIEYNFGKKIRNIVEEVTDDKNLSRDERKRLQILNASTSSPEAKLVKLADKLYNLRDLERQTPRGWTRGRVQEYFAWSRKVVNGLLGSNKAMEYKLEQLFVKRGV